MAAIPAAGAFNYRATGVLGDKRETMLINEIHARVSTSLRAACLNAQELVLVVYPIQLNYYIYIQAKRVSSM